MSQRIPLFSLLCVLLLTNSASGQTSSNNNQAKEKAAKTKAAKAEPIKSDEEDAVATQRRMVAISLLTTLADDAQFS